MQPAAQEAAAAAALTATHRLAQLRIRTATLRNFLTLWPLWSGDSQSFGRLVQAAMPLVQANYRLSSAAAVGYYQAFRRAEQVDGEPTPRVAAALDPVQVTRSMWVTGEVMTRNALAAGRTPTEARRQALVRVSGAVTRHVLAGGRTALLDSAAADPQALGWARVTDGNPCYFCLTLASRGAVYKSEETASFEAHDHCDCGVIVVYRHTAIPNLQRWRSVYDAAQNHGEASGLLQPGENPSGARLNAVRRYLAAEHAHEGGS